MGQKGSSALLEKKLLNNYELGDFFLATPSRTVLGKETFLLFLLIRRQATISVSYLIVFQHY